MEPIKPMQPMAPMPPSKPWWPADLGSPSSSGGQNDVRYAFFPEKRRLLIDRGGKVENYDSGDHDISGVSQAGGPGQGMTFTSAQGDVSLDELTPVG